MARFKPLDLSSTSLTCYQLSCPGWMCLDFLHLSLNLKSQCQMGKGMSVQALNNFPLVLTKEIERERKVKRVHKRKREIEIVR